MYIYNFKYELKKLFQRLESEEVLVALKEEFIEQLIVDYKFDDSYSENKKYDYFNNLELYITFLKEGLYKQKIIANLSFQELYKIYYYEGENKILYMLSVSIEYIESNYTEIDISKKKVIKHDIPNAIKSDLEKIKKILSLNNQNKKL